MSDMAILAPVNEDEGAKVGELYGKLYFTFGGLGFDEIYRDPQNVDRLASRIEAAELAHTTGYNPGWAYKATSKTDIYDQLVANAKRQRIWQMRNHALRLQNDAYYEAYRAHAELQRRNPVFEEGTPAYAESARLNKLMNEASASIKQLPPPEDTTPYARLNEPDPDTKLKQLGSGFNGPAKSSVDIFRSEEEVRESWLSRAYPAPELAALLSKIDFSQESLVSYNVGQRMNASGAIMITELAHRESFGGYSISTRLGVVPESCGVPFVASYPFVLGAVVAVPDAQVTASGTSNFPADCGPIMSGFPAAAR
jgi:hypothetical protein